MLWRRNRGHEIHSIREMTDAIAEYFTVRVTQTAPYLYRYLVPVLPETFEAATFMAEVLAQEIQLGARGEIIQIGRRIVAD